MIRLYIDNKEVDLPENFSIEYTYNSIDVLEPAAIKNSFSKTVSLPSTKNNDAIFGEIYRLDRNIIESDDKFTSVNFDPRKRVPFTITRYGGIIEAGYIQMNSINIDNNKITYNITCFSGLGDFFYNLMSNEDGTDKSLADLYYKWKPVYTYFDQNDTLTKEQEDNIYIVNWTSEVMTRSFESIGPVDKGDGSTFITEDLTVIPVYNGLYDDFKSDTMIVDNFNNLWGLGERLYTGKFGEHLNSHQIEILNTYMPPKVYLDKDAYSAIEYPTNSGHFWQVTKVEREMEPFEAKDLRVTKMNIGLKLSKLMRTISNPENNGGYKVIWDEEITESPYWKYSWIMLDKPDYEKDVVNSGSGGQAGLNIGTLPGDAKQWIQWQFTPYTTKDFNRPYLHINYMPSFRSVYSDELRGNFLTKVNSGMTKRTMFIEDSSTGWMKWGISFTVWNIYDENNRIKQFHTLYYFGDGNHFGTNRYGGRIVDTDVAISRVRDAMRFGVPRFEMDADYKFINSNQSPEVIDSSGCWSRLYSEAEKGGVRKYYTLFTSDVTCLLDEAKIEIPLNTDISNLRVEANSYQIGYAHDPFTLKWAVFIDNEVAGEQSVPQKLRPLIYLTFDDFSTSYNINYVLSKNSITTVQEEGSESSTDLARANKKILLGGSQTPYKYLTDFTKLLNIKYKFDKASKTITIMPKNKYYKDEIIDLTNNIDNSKQKIIKPIITDTKYVALEVPTPETYAAKLYNSKNNLPYGAFKFNTKYEFNNDKKNIFDEIIYSELVPYNLTSNFFNYDSEMCRLISIFGVVSHTNTLFKGTGKNANIGEKVETLYNFPGWAPRSGFNAYAKDLVPKLCTFDKETNHLDECNTSFVFLNGYYTNYYYGECDTNISGTAISYCLYPYITLSDSLPLMKDLLGDECYLWSYQWGLEYDREANIRSAIGLYSSAPMYLPYFSKYLYNTYNGTDNFMTGTWSGSNNIIAAWSVNAPKQMFANSNDIKFSATCPLIPSFTTYPASVYAEYTVKVSDYLSSQNYIYPKYWKTELEDLYDKNGKQVTLYVRIDGDPEEALRKFYYFDGCYWMITKIENYSITNNDNWFNKVTFVKVRNISSYTNIDQ